MANGTGERRPGTRPLWVVALAAPGVAQGLGCGHEDVPLALALHQAGGLYWVIVCLLVLGVVLVRWRAVMRRERGGRRRAEADRRNLMARLDGIVSNAGEGIVVAKAGHVVFCNPRILAISGYSEDELLGMSVAELVHPEELERVSDKHERRMAGDGGEDTYHTRLLARSGETIWVQMTSTSVWWDGGPAALVFITDVTSRHAGEELLRRTMFSIENVGDGVFWVQTDGRFTYVNKAARRMFGYSEEEFLSKTVLDVDPEMTLEVWQLFMQRARQERNFSFDALGRTGYGSIITLEIGVHYLSENGEEFIFAFGRDITERRRVEVDLRESEELYRATLSSISDAVFITDDNGVFTFVCPGVDALFGYSFEEIMDMGTIWNLLDGGQCPNLDKDAVDALVNAECVVKDKDGRSLVVLVNAKRVNIKGGTLLFTCLDVSDRVAARRALDASEERYRTLVAELQVGVVVFNPRGEAVLVNKKAHVLFNSTESGQERPRPGFVDERGRPLGPGEQPERRVIDGEHEIRGLVLGLADGDGAIQTWVLVDAFGDFGDDGELRQVVVYYVDITKRRLAEMELNRRIEVEALLSAISSEFISMEPQAVEFGLRIAMERLGLLFGASRVFLCRTGEPTQEWNATKLDECGQACVCPDFSPGSWWSDAMDRDGRAVVAELGSLSPSRVPEVALLMERGVGGVATIPLSFGGERMGVLWLEFASAESSLNADDVMLLETAANLMAQVLKSRSASLAVERELALRQALARLFKPLASEAASIASIGAVILREVRGLTGGRHGYVASIDPDNGDLLAHTLSEMMSECAVDREDVVRFAIGEDGRYPTLWGESLNTRKPMLVNDASRQPSAAGLPQGHVPIDEFLAVPVMLGSELVGQIALANKPGGFTESDLEIVGQFAQYYALAIQRMRAVEELEESEERYRSLVESMNEGVATLDTHGGFTYVNHRLSTMLGVARTDLVGMNIRDFLDERNSRTFDGEFVRRKDGWAEPYELVWSRGDGEQVYTLVSPTPLFDEHGGFKGSFGVMTDITKMKLLEGQLHQAQKLESIGSLAAGIAHEINTPSQYVENNTRYLEKSFADILGVLELYGELRSAVAGGAPTASIMQRLDRALRDSDLDYLREEIPDALADALEGIERISKIVKSVKQFAHPGREEKELVDLNEAVRNTVAVSTNEWKYNSDVSLDLQDDLPRVPCVAGDMNQVLLNLIVNAAHAVTERVQDGGLDKGTITVRTRLDGDAVRIDVVDDGAGIPEGLRKSVFNPFFTTKEPGKGTGQGLAIAHTVVVEKHGGSIGFESTEGEGTTFHVALPLEDVKEGGR